MRQVVFLIRTIDRKGLLAAISGFFTSRDLNIIECRQYTDVIANEYFTRILVDLPPEITRGALEAEFSVFAKEYALDYSIHYIGDIRNVAVLVSKTSHCLYDILVNSEENTLGGGRVVLAIGNHPDLEEVANKFRVPYFCCPVEKGQEKVQEAQILELLARHHVDLVVLARYMRILSDDFIAHYPSRIINIHHAFLPAFMGGDPYRRAWERGVKMIGATAHYATADLDEGPIIEQDVEPITHESTPADLKQRGRDIERRVLTRAVRAHLEHRVIITGNRTIVFSK